MSRPPPIQPGACYLLLGQRQWRTAPPTRWVPREFKPYPGSHSSYIGEREISGVRCRVYQVIRGRQEASITQERSGIIRYYAQPVSEGEDSW